MFSVDNPFFALIGITKQVRVSVPNGPCGEGDCYTHTTKWVWQ